MNNAVFGKTMENVRKYRALNLIQHNGERTIQYLKQITILRRFSKNICQLQKWKKTERIIIKTVYSRLSILKLKEILMYEFWYDYVKLNYREKAKFCYVDTDSFIAYIKTDDIYKDITEDVESKFDISNYELDRPFPKGQNKKVVRLMADNLCG